MRGGDFISAITDLNSIPIIVQDLRMARSAAGN
jgi:hypothetical protein